MASTGSVGCALDSLVASVARGGVRDLPHEELTDLLVAARRAQARLEAVVLAVVGEVDARGSHVHSGALSAAAWLRQHDRVTAPSAAAAVRTARTLRCGLVPGARAALEAGELSARHVQVLTDAVREAPREAVALIEPEALAVAREADVRALASLMRAFTHALDPDAADEAALRRYQRRGLTLSPTLDRAMVLHGFTDEVSGATLATAIDAATPLVTGDRRTAAQRRLDGLVDIARHYLDTAPGRPPGSTLHHQVIVTVDAQTLTAAGTTPPDPVTTPAGPVTTPAGPGATPAGPGATLAWIGDIAGSTAGRLACDAQVLRTVIGDDGAVVATSTDRRFFTLAQKRAMIARDGDRCVWPWCDRPVSWSDGHHVLPVSQGGPTTVENGALPCQAHHLHLHEGGWTLHRQPDGRYLARHRDGRTHGPEPHRTGRNRPPPHRRQ